MTQRLPDFFVVGAQKAGTTSLHDRLVKHPNVCLPKLKETQFFAFEEKFSRGFDWYCAQFPDCHQDQIMGEICPDYMYFERAAERMRSCVEFPKLIFIFREPLKRAYSHYLMSVRQGFESLSFDDALKKEDERLAHNDSSVIYHSYMARGAYAEQVERYLAVFPSAEYLFIKFEDLTDNGCIGRKTFFDICDFLGLPQLDTHIVVHSNPASRPRSMWLRDKLYGQSLVKRVLGKLLPEHMKEKLAVTLDRWNQRKIGIKEKTEVSPRFVQRAMLETQKIQTLTGLDLNLWKGVE